MTATKTAKPTALVLTEEQKSLLASTIYATWQYIGSDAMALEGKMTNAGAIELCIDAGRLAQCGGERGPEAEKLLKALFIAHGYDTVARMLRRLVSLY